MAGIRNIWRPVSMKKYNLNCLLILSSLLVLAVFVVLPVSGATFDVVVQGDDYALAGVATGDPDTGVAVWIFGKNYYQYDTTSVENNQYSYELTGAVTGAMSLGMYSAFIQHPMYNGKFDVYPEYNSPGAGQTSVVSTSGDESFIVQGPGSLPGPQAAYTLKRMLASTNIDDTAVEKEFMIVTPSISRKEVVVYDGGADNYVILGSTNLAPGDQLFYEIRSAAFLPSTKGNVMPENTLSGKTEIQSTDAGNIWIVPVDLSGFVPGDYIFRIEHIGTETVEEYPFSLPFSSTINEVAAQSISTPVSTSTSPGVQPIATEQETPVPTQAPWSMGTLIIGVLGSFLLNARH